MGCQSAHVHDACRFAIVISWYLGCAPLLLSLTGFSNCALLSPDGLASIWRQEGIAGWWKGTTLALVGVSNGAVQFMAYEEMKRWGFEQKRKQFEKAGQAMGPEDDKLVSPSPFLMHRV